MSFAKKMLHFRSQRKKTFDTYLKPIYTKGEAERRKHRQLRQIRKEAAVTVATGVQLLFFAS